MRIIDYLNTIVDTSKEVVYTNNEDINLDTLSDSEREHYMQTGQVPYGWVANYPVDDEYAKYPNSNGRSVAAFNNLIKFVYETKSVDTRNVRFCGANNDFKRTKDSDIFWMDNNGLRQRNKNSDFSFFMKDNQAPLHLIFLDGNINNIPSGHFASFYYNGIRFKEKVDPNISSAVKSIFTEVSTSKKGISVEEDMFLTVLVLGDQDNPLYTKKSGEVVYVEKKLLYRTKQTENIFKELNGFSTVSENNGDFRGTMVRVGRYDGNYSLLPVEPMKLPQIYFNDKTRAFLNKNASLSSLDVYDLATHGTIQVGGTPTPYDLLTRLFVKDDFEKKKQNGDVYQTKDYFATPFDYDKVMSDGDFKRIQAFYGNHSVSSKTYDGQEVINTEFVPGLLQNIVEGSEYSSSNQPQPTPASAGPKDFTSQGQTVPTEDDIDFVTANEASWGVEKESKPNNAGWPSPATNNVNDYDPSQFLTEDDIPF